MHTNYRANQKGIFNLVQPIGLAVLVAFLLVLNTIFRSQYGDQRSQSNFQPQPSAIADQPESSARPSVSVPTIPLLTTTQPQPTEGWKTYVDKPYGYSIRYPAGWFVRPAGELGYGAVATFTNYDPNKASERSGWTKNMIKVEIGQVIKPADITFASWTKTFTEQLVQSPISKDYDMILQSQEAIKLHGIDGARYIFTYRGLPPTQAIHLPLNSTTVLQIATYPADSSYMNVLAIMLSSLKFSY